MPQHPAAPEELVDLIEGYRQAMRSMIDLARSCPEAKADAPTPCPGWSVKDQFAHIAALEAYFDGGDYPVLELPERGHLRSDFAEWMEYGVQARRHMTLAEVVDELETLLFNRLATLSNPDLTVDSMVLGPMGKEITLGDLMGRRLTDIWVHEQDVRESLGRIGNLDSPAAAEFVSRIVQAMPVVLRKRLDLPAGTTVILESTGPVTARVGVRMGRDSHDHVVAHSLFTGATEADEQDAGSDTPDDGGRAAEDTSADTNSAVTISMTTDALTRRAAGRRSTQDTTYKVIGDEDTARAVLDVLAITP
ncbi:MAG: maleylpyruvate isomerase family mycothiol-dependent enzyme [Ornithinimicrobium sp.]